MPRNRKFWRPAHRRVSPVDTCIHHGAMLRRGGGRRRVLARYASPRTSSQHVSTDTPGAAAYHTTVTHPSPSTKPDTAAPPPARHRTWTRHTCDGTRRGGGGRPLTAPLCTRNWAGRSCNDWCRRHRRRRPAGASPASGELPKSGIRDCFVWAN